MDTTSFDDIRTSIDQVATTQQLLLACMGTPEQAFPTQPNHSVGIEGEVIGMGTVKPLTHLRLDEIKRDVGAFKSTWENLREQYPPGKSDFAPLSFTASSWTAIASAGANGLDDGLETDETYSQLATMTAYGVELLRKALSGPQVDRRLTRQVYNLLATLCAMLTDSQDRHRSKVTRAVGEKVEGFERVRATNKDPQSCSGS
ncbi:hypothetical protein GGI19_001292 [Coemansia pectinata]|uniref:Uncharacterized protein n=1 Tax=Coemansia pectinata TaxID=1052879 RepID=A0A9W8H1X3_9FUNG|nr:hypothetical protein GGI19_001292 [Coemansia pectinata]